MSIKKTLLMALGAAALFASNGHALNAGWTAEGRITDVYVGTKGVYEPTANVGGMIISLLNGTTTKLFVIPLNETNEVRAMVSQVYNAKTNGYWVQVHNDASGNWGGYQKVSRILVQQ